MKPGRGERVMHTLMSLVEGAGMTLEVASTNAKAIRLYEKLGLLAHGGESALGTGSGRNHAGIPFDTDKNISALGSSENHQHAQQQQSFFRLKVPIFPCNTKYSCEKMASLQAKIPLLLVMFPVFR